MQQPLQNPMLDTFYLLWLFPQETDWLPFHLPFSQVLFLPSFGLPILTASSSLQLIKDCNENVQRMKSTEELIYLSQNMEFECKVKTKEKTDNPT